MALKISFLHLLNPDPSRKTMAYPINHRCKPSPYKPTSLPTLNTLIRGVWGS